MRPVWKFLEVDNHQDISDQVYEYVINQTDILNPAVDLVPYNVINVSHMLIHVPLLKDFLDQRFLVPSYIALIVVPANSVPYIHADYLDPHVRLLWPVRNCAGSSTRMYVIPKKYLELNHDPNASANKFESVIYYSITKERDWPILTEFELLQPVVFDSSIPHGVQPNPNETNHRISFAIGFNKDLPISKSVKAWFGFQR
jgi:hypothetical protein